MGVKMNRQQKRYEKKKRQIEYRLKISKHPNEDYLLQMELNNINRKLRKLVKVFR